MDYIKFGTTFEGLHNWPNAPDEVGFLAVPHRHVFHVTMKVEVFHEDRELEFIIEKRHLQKVIKELFGFAIGDQSCEMIGREIAEALTDRYQGRKISIEVMEDGENGCGLQYDFS